MTTTAPKFVLIAHFSDGTAAFVSRARESGRDGARESSVRTTPSRNWALVLGEREATEAVSRLHGVKALGHYHRAVSYYDAAPVRG